MKMYLKRIIPILLSALLCINMSVAAFAEGEVADSVPAPELGSAETVYGSGWINVSETGGVTFGSLEPEIMPLSYYEPDITVTSFDAAAAYMRECMIARKTNFSIEWMDAYDATNVNSKEELRQVVADIVAKLQAKAYEHGTDPEGGDYLELSLTAGVFLPGGGTIKWSYGPMPANPEDYSKFNGMQKLILDFTVNYYTTREQEDELNRKIDEVIASLELDGKTNYEKVKAVHDWIATHVTYDDEHLTDNNYPLKQTAYAAMINGTSVCQGYATLFYKMMLKLGIDCRVVTGFGFGNKAEPGQTVQGEAHAWNIVKICDKYYNVDCTWDSNYYEGGGGYTAFFLKGSTNFDKDHTAYDNVKEWLNTYKVSDTDFDTEHPDAVHDYDPSGRCTKCGEMKESSGTAVLKGDVNGNGEVELGDAVAILRYLAKLDVGETFVEKAAYFNDDEVIDLSDAVDILRMLAKIS